jgi:phosphate transport system ATP-binding protein
VSTLTYSAIISERSQNGWQPHNMKGAHAKFEVRNLSFWYGSSQALYDINLVVPERAVTAFIGPSGCGKSTLLRVFNRMNDLIEGTHHTGDVCLEGEDIYGRGTSTIELRRRVGMVFQKSNPFPKSIFENVVFGLRVAGLRQRAKLYEITERCLKQAALWDG